MKNLRIAVVLMLALPVAALAAKGQGPKAKIMAKYDLNQDGKLDAEESAAIQKDFAAAPAGDLAGYDKNKDGKLSADEIARMVPGSGKKDGGEKKPKSDGGKKDKSSDHPKADDPKEGSK